MTWKKLNRAKLPKDGIIVGGSWRPGWDRGKLEWSMSSAFKASEAHYIDKDRTHYIDLPVPPPPHQP